MHTTSIDIYYTYETGRTYSTIPIFTIGARPIETVNGGSPPPQPTPSGAASLRSSINAWTLDIATSSVYRTLRRRQDIALLQLDLWTFFDNFHQTTSTAALIHLRLWTWISVHCWIWTAVNTTVSILLQFIFRIILISYCFENDFGYIFFFLQKIKYLRVVTFFHS